MTTPFPSPSAAPPPGEGLSAFRSLPLGEGRGDDASAPRPRGFTLVELLVVVGIIAMLAALVTPAVIRARSAARNAAIRTEIDLLHMAMMTYRNEFGSFPPCFVNSIDGTDAASRHLTRLFPRMAAGNAATQASALNYINSGTTVAIGVTPSTALAQWLYGYTGNPMLPVTTGNTTVVSGSLRIGGSIVSRKKLFDFDLTRTGTTGRPNYFPAGLRASSYIYITPDQYAVVFPDGANNYQAEASAPGVFFNPDTFQILCAGVDQIWGNADDLSNFWRGTRAEFLRSGQ